MDEWGWNMGFTDAAASKLLTPEEVNAPILTTYHSLLTTYYLSLTTYYLLLTTYYMLLTTYYLLLTTH